MSLQFGSCEVVVISYENRIEKKWDLTRVDLDAIRSQRYDCNQEPQLEARWYLRKRGSSESEWFYYFKGDNKVEIQIRDKTSST